MKPTRYIANFDSAAGMLRATSRFLHGRDFPGLGIAPSLRPLGAVVNAIPRRLREQLYAFGGWGEAISPKHLHAIRAEEIAEWVASKYPRRRYPALFVGSSNGALVHLAAALRIPWLPQTFLIPVRQSGIHPDEPRAAMRAGVAQGRALLDANPELQLHHMHDPNQDRLMVRHMAYFRVKRRRLGRAYEQFLRDRLVEGATVFIVDCRLSWPTTRVGERHYFQHGALGGASKEELFGGSPRVVEYLTRYRSHRRSWDPPEPDGERPEAEWGFEPSLADDIEAVADRCGYRVRRIVFDEPEDLSPLTADLYQWWYRRNGIPADRLLVESFLLLEPWWAITGGLVPFWMVFNMEPSARALERYLDDREPFEHMLMMLFSHGTESVGLASTERWRSLLDRARTDGRFLGVDPGGFPSDFGNFFRYQADLKRLIKERVRPERLTLALLDEFLAERAGAHEVKWS